MQIGILQRRASELSIRLSSLGSVMNRLRAGDDVEIYTERRERRPWAGTIREVNRTGAELVGFRGGHASITGNVHDPNSFGLLVGRSRSSRMETITRVNIL